MIQNGTMGHADARFALFCSVLCHKFSTTMARDNKRKAEAIAAPLSEEEAKKCNKAYQKVLQKEKDLKTIVDANTKEFREAVNAQKQMTTAPERKPVLEVDDDMKPALNVGDYVKVDADTSLNMNRPEGFGFMVQVRGVGAATIVSVKYDCAFDSARTHHAIPFQSTTRAIFGQDFEGLKVKRTKVQPDLYSPPNPLPQQASSVDNSNLSHSERLAMQLNQAALTIYPCVPRRQCRSSSRGVLRSVRDRLLLRSWLALGTPGTTDASFECS
jgi:hypothetical protein